MSNTMYKGRPLVIGERIPETSLTFIQSVLPRRGLFQCDCGTLKFYNMSDIERGERKTCGCRIHRKDFVKKYIDDA